MPDTFEPPTTEDSIVNTEPLKGNIRTPRNLEIVWAAMAANS